MSETQCRVCAAPTDAYLCASCDWREIPGFPGYEVNADGVIRSWHAARIGKPSPYIMRGAPEGSGYIIVQMKHESGRRPFLAVHRAVMRTFVGPRPDGLEIRHLNGNKLDNRLANLAYGTKSENQQDSVRHKTHAQSKRTHCKVGHELVVLPANENRRERRYCRQCRTEAQRQRRARLGSAA